MDYIFKDGKHYYYADHAQFTEIVRELIGDDAADYVGSLPTPDEVVSAEDMEELEEELKEQERIADDYMEQVHKGFGLSRKLYHYVRKSDVAYDSCYKDTVEEILDMVDKLSEALED